MYDKSIYQTFLDKQMSIFEEYGACVLLKFEKKKKKKHAQKKQKKKKKKKKKKNTSWCVRTDEFKTI